MARLFISPREMQFINDVTKEFVKDVVGQKVFYYAISTMKTTPHPVYDEAVTKVFERPIEINVIASQPQWETKHNQFGMEQTTKIEFFVQRRDLLDKGITLAEGDFFTYGDAVFEVVGYYQMNNIFGQEEYEASYKFIGQLARPGAFDPKNFFAPQEDARSFAEANVQKTFVQQRGLPENQEGATGDFRQMRDRLGDDMADIALGEGPRKVDVDESKKSSKFYEE